MQNRRRASLIIACLIIGGLAGWSCQADADCDGHLVPQFPVGFACVQEYQPPRRQLGSDAPQFKEWLEKTGLL